MSRLEQKWIHQTGGDTHRGLPKQASDKPFPGHSQREPLIFRPTTVPEILTFMEEQVLTLDLSETSSITPKKNIAPVGAGHSFANIPVFGDNTIGVQIHEMDHGISEDWNSLFFLGQDTSLNDIGVNDFQEITRPWTHLKLKYLHGLDPEVLTPRKQFGSTPHKYAIRVGGGVTLESLDKWLQLHQLALPSIGQVEFQTVAGLLATSTHGSSLLFSSADQAVIVVEAVILRKNKPVWIRIEPEVFKRDISSNQAEIVWDDKLLNAFKVSLGMLGLITSVTFLVQDNFTLLEHRQLYNWDYLRDQIKDRHSNFWPKQTTFEKDTSWKYESNSSIRPELDSTREYDSAGKLDSPKELDFSGRKTIVQVKNIPYIHARHTEFMINPYTFPTRNIGKCSVLLTTKNSTPLTLAGKDLGVRRRNLLFEAFRLIRGPKLQRLETKVLTTLPTHNVLNTVSLMAQWDRIYLGDSIDVQTAGLPSEVRVISSETAVPLCGSWKIRRNKMIRVIEYVLKYMRHQKIKTNLPLLFRFAQRSSAPLSMLYSPDPDAWFLLIEMPIFTDTYKSDDYLPIYHLARKLERKLMVNFAGRPHLGKVQTPDHISLQKVYPGWEQWNEVFKEYNYDVFNTLTAEKSRYGFKT